MELSIIYLNCLKKLEEKLNIANSKELINNTIKCSLGLGNRSDDHSDQQDFIKLAETAILTLFTLAVKYGLDNESFKLFLDQNNIPISIVSELLNTYDTYSKDIYEFILRNEKPTATNVTDVAWKLQCDYKSSACNDKSKEIIYNINLGNFNSETGNRETVTEFECNPEELQSFINKLKEIERHCDKLIQK